VRVDWEIAKRGWRRHAAYPWATAAGVFTNTIFGFLQAYILLAVYRHRTDVGGYKRSAVGTTSTRSRLFETWPKRPLHGRIGLSEDLLARRFRFPWLA
jgi:hypothetical protein